MNIQKTNTVMAQIIKRIQVTQDVKETGELLSFLTTFTSAVVRSLADGKIDFFDLAKFFELVPKVKPAFEGIRAVPTELANLTADERAYLVALVRSDLQLNSDVTEDLVNEGLDLCLHFLTYAQKIKSIRQA